MQRRQQQRLLSGTTISSHLDRTQLEDKLAELRLSQQTIQEQLCTNAEQISQHQQHFGYHHHHYHQQLHHHHHHMLQQTKLSQQPPMDLQSCNMSQGSGLGRPALTGKFFFLLITITM